MNQGYNNQGRVPTYDATRVDDEPLFTTPPEERLASMQRPTVTFGAPPMGEPSEPSAHPDNPRAAAYTMGDSADETGQPMRLGDPSAGRTSMATGVGASETTPAMGGGAVDPTTGTQTDKGFFGGAGAQQTAQHTAQPTHPSAMPSVGSKPGSPYVQTQEVPASGTSPTNQIVENFNRYMAKAEVLAGNIWSHMNTGASPLDAARGKISQGIKLVQQGGFEGLYKSTFGPMADTEQLRKTYACYLSTSTGPVAGTLYITNLKFAFCSDRPLAYAPTPGQTAWSYYKMVVPLEKVREVIPSFNEAKPAEKYIQVATIDGHDFWYMGFVNYDKAEKNMQYALKNIGVVDPNGGLKAPWAGMKVPGMKKTATGSTPTTPTSAAAGTTAGTPTGVPGHVPTAGGPTPNYPANQTPQMST